MTTSIVTHELGKQYLLSAVDSARTIREGISAGVRHPVQTLRRRGARTDVLWALRDVSLEIGDGEAVGIIGHNGAGKSTLLKVLSRITEPTSGWAEVRGRVGSLLEVGTGFHPELTGRENVYLNGAILGMARREIAAKFDDIVSFAGVERFLETPVKRYSTGMRTRLAFSIAAYVEPDVLLVDEVLAVGDAEFQRRCLSRMDEVSKSGRTVLFVSHNMSAIRSLCTRGVVLHAGSVAFDGGVGDAVEHYYDLVRTPEEGAPSNGFSVPYLVGHDIDDTRVTSGESFTVASQLTVPEGVAGFSLFCIIHDMDGAVVCHLKVPSTEVGVGAEPEGTFLVEVALPGLWLAPGAFTLQLKAELWGTFATGHRLRSPSIILDVDGTSPAVPALLHPEASWVVEPAPDRPPTAG